MPYNMDISKLRISTKDMEVMDYLCDNHRAISSFLGYNILKKLDSVRKNATVKNHSAVFGYIGDNGTLVLFYIAIKEIVMITIEDVKTNGYLLKVYLEAYPNMTREVKDSIITIASETCVRKSRMMMDKIGDKFDEIFKHL